MVTWKNVLLPPEKSVQTNKFKDALQQIKKVTPETRKRIAPAVKAKDRVSAPSAGETNTCLEMQRELVPQHAASSREHFSEDHDRSLLAKRCPPVVEPDPLGSFLMLRAQQASPVKAANQSSSGPPGGTVKQLSPIWLNWLLFQLKLLFNCTFEI